MSAPQKLATCFKSILSRLKKNLSNNCCSCVPCRMSEALLPSPLSPKTTIFMVESIRTCSRACSNSSTKTSGFWPSIADNASANAKACPKMARRTYTPLVQKVFWHLRVQKRSKVLDCWSIQFWKLEKQTVHCGHNRFILSKFWECHVNPYFEIDPVPVSILPHIKVPKIKFWSSCAATTQQKSGKPRGFAQAQNWIGTQNPTIYIYFGDRSLGQFCPTWWSRHQIAPQNSSATSHLRAKGCHGATSTW